MSTITAILEADADGTLHLPLPAELQHGKVEVTATIRAVVESAGRRPTREEALAALRCLRKSRTFVDVTDPVAWQREIRQDRPLPGRN